MNDQKVLASSDILVDIKKADAQYKSFPSFEEWAKCLVDNDRWGRYTSLITKRADVSEQLLMRARDVVKRATAIDTGAIEGLYDVDRGFTFTVATEAAMWQVALDKKGEQAKALIHSQLDALDYVMDFATKRQPITEAWIRSLHAAMCKSQETYKVMTEIGPQTQPLPKGEYKHLPNHVMLKDGTMHAYAPADLTPAEMHRFVEAIEGESFRTAHPALQASYAHYAFVCIHPFADGNGRVARALACVFTYRSASIPVMILAENRKQYLDSLHASDDGDHQSFVDFVTQRCFDAILMVNESIRTALVPHPSEFLEPIKNLYVTRGGFTHEQVDEMGKMLFKVFDDELKKGVEKYQIPNSKHR